MNETTPEFWQKIITPAQGAKIWQAISIVNAVRHKMDYPPIGHWADGRASEGQWHPDLGKSRLLGRILYDGRPPLPEAPPRSMAACAYASVEPTLSHYYLSGAGPLLARVADGQVIEWLDPGFEGELSEHLLAYRDRVVANGDVLDAIRHVWGTVEWWWS